MRDKKVEGSEGKMVFHTNIGLKKDKHRKMTGTQELHTQISRLHHLLMREDVLWPAPSLREPFSRSNQNQRSTFNSCIPSPSTPISSPSLSSLISTTGHASMNSTSRYQDVIRVILDEIILCLKGITYPCIRSMYECSLLKFLQYFLSTRLKITVLQERICFSSWLLLHRRLLFLFPISLSRSKSMLFSVLPLWVSLENGSN